MDWQAQLTVVVTTAYAMALGGVIGLERELKKGLAYLETCRVCATRESVNGCVHCRQDHGMEGEPALVAGITVGNEMVRPRGPREGLIRVEDVGRRGERE